MSEPVRLRFAPSPTGKLHIGGARTALFNWAYARRLGGAFVLRIEDTDPERSRPEHEREILEGLAWLGVQWDEGPDVGGPFGPYRQSERAERHLAIAAGLFEAGWAYRCFCSSERLTELREAQTRAAATPAYDRACRDLPREEARARIERGERPVLRFAVPAGETRLVDLIRGEVTFQNAEVDDWVMVRADGSPTYNFVVVCDDVDMQITHVCRGEEHLTNTPKQVLLYRALNATPPSFAHLPLMLGSDGKKLSKRTGDTALLDYRDKGFPAEAVVNFLALQGWALDGATEVFSVAELVERFELSGVSKGGAIFDIDKFRWLAGEYVRRDDPERLLERCAPFLVAAGLVTREECVARRAWLLRVLASARERIQLYSELPERVRYLFAKDDAVEYAQDALANTAKQSDPAGMLAAYRDWLRARVAGGVDAAALRAATKAWMAERGAKPPALFQPLRLALTGAAGGPDLFEVIDLLGAERSLARVEACRARLG